MIKKVIKFIRRKGRIIPIRGRNPKPRKGKNTPITKGKDGITITKDKDGNTIIKSKEGVTVIADPKPLSPWDKEMLDKLGRHSQESLKRSKRKLNASLDRLEKRMNREIKAQRKQRKGKNTPISAKDSPSLPFRLRKNIKKAIRNSPIGQEGVAKYLKEK